MVPTLTPQVVQRGLSTSSATPIRSSLFSSPFDELDPFRSPLMQEFFQPWGGLMARNRGDVTPNERLWSVGPRIDVVEEPTKFVLSAELAGVRKEDVHIQVDADRRRLTIQGQTKSEYSSPPLPSAPLTEDAATDAQAPVEGERDPDSREVANQQQQQHEVQQRSSGNSVGHALVSERTYGSSSRSFTLPSTADLANEAALKARFDNGLLRIEVPKKSEQHAKTRTISIDSA